MSGIGSCQSCGYQAGLFGLKNGLCEKCRNKQKGTAHSSSARNGKELNIEADCTSLTTKLLMSATHLYPNDFKEELKERIEHPYKSLAPEYGIDINKIDQELKGSRVNNILKFFFIFIIVLVVFLIVIQDPEDNWGILIPTLALTSLIEFFYIRSAKKRVRSILASDNDGANKNEANKKSDRNVVIFGGYSPFVGSGFDIDSWSFSINTKQADDKQKPVEEVLVTELHERIKKDLQSLGLDDLNITDELYINGKDVNLVAHLLPNGRLSKPVERVDQYYLVSKANSNEKRERHYRVARIPMWNNQVVLSMHYRFLAIQDNLFIEVRFFILPPLKEKYLAIEDIPLKPTGREFGENLIQAVFFGAFSWIGVVIHLMVFVQGGFLAESAKKNAWKREVESNRLYNYGWGYSLREKWASTSYQRYFQKVDKDVAHKLLTSEFLSSLQKYLSEKNISTDKFSQTTTKIVNEGVMISGGEVKAESFAVGNGANIAKNAINVFKSRGAGS